MQKKKVSYIITGTINMLIIIAGVLRIKKNASEPASTLN